MVQLPAGGRTTATYDGEGKRREYEDSAGLRHFIWDGENILFQTDADDALDRDYTYNPQLGVCPTSRRDEMNQLTLEARSGDNSYGLEYSYDEAGNRPDICRIGKHLR